MTEEEKAIEAIKNDLEWHKKELKPMYRECLNIAIKSLENQIKIKQILSDSSLDEDDCLMKIWEIIDENNEEKTCSYYHQEYNKNVCYGTREKEECNCCGDKRKCKF